MAFGVTVLALCAAAAQQKVASASATADRRKSWTVCSPPSRSPWQGGLRRCMRQVPRRLAHRRRCGRGTYPKGFALSLALAERHARGPVHEDPRHDAADTPGTISDEVKVEILAYLLQQNGFPAGTAELKRDLPTLDSVRIVQRGRLGRHLHSGAGRAAVKLPRLKDAARVATVRSWAALIARQALKGPAFLANWEDGSVNRLFAKIRDTMPPSNTDQLSAATKLDVVAFILRENGFPAGFGPSCRQEATRSTPFKLSRKPSTPVARRTLRWSRSSVVSPGMRRAVGR